MAHRRPGRDYVASLILEDSESEHTANIAESIEHSNPKTCKSNPHPALTDFGLDTLSVFLSEKLKEKVTRAQTLQNHPHLATVDAEKSKLRNLVNSNRSIDARVRNGRLEICSRRVTSRRSRSVPASEGDNESTQKRSRSFTISANSNGVSKQKKHGLVFQRGGLPMACTSQSRHSFSSLSWDSKASKASRYLLNGSSNSLHEMNGEEQESEIDMSEIEWSPTTNPTSSRTLQLQTTFMPSVARHTQQSINITRVAGLGSSSLSASAPTYASNAFGSPESSRASQLPVDTAVSPNTNHDMICTTNSSNSWAADPARSLSFERHANGVRQSTRAFQDIPETPSNVNNIHDFAAEIRIARPRKLNGMNNGSHFQLATPDVEPSVLQELRTLRSHDDSHDIRTAQKSVPGATLFTSAVADGTDEHGPIISNFRPAPQIEGPETFFSAKRLRNMLTGRTSQRTGKDTFYSASSDDTASDSENDENIQVGQTRDDNQDSLNSRQDKNETFGGRSITFQYQNVVPESLPTNMYQARENCRKIWSAIGLDRQGLPDPKNSDLWYTTQYTNNELNPQLENILGAPNDAGQYPRIWQTSASPLSAQDALLCPPVSCSNGFSEEILPMVCAYLSSQDVRNLRLVNRLTALAVLPLMIRSTVVKFGLPLFGPTNGETWEGKSSTPAEGSLLQMYGSDVNKFGISFDMDTVGLANAKLKSIEAEVNAWFGNYTWPKETYPRFPQLKELEDLVDGNNPLLKNTMKNLSHVSELALSIDSGHGWLNGPDISDLALFKQKQEGGSSVFGKAFNTPDVQEEFALRQYFRWGQENTINAYTKRFSSVRGRGGLGMLKINRKQLHRFRVRDYDEYLTQSAQPDFNRVAHTGGPVLNPVTQPTAPPAQLGTVAANTANFPAQMNAIYPAAGQATVPNSTNISQQAGSMIAGGPGGLVDTNNGFGPTSMVQINQHPLPNLLGPAQATLQRRATGRMRDHRRRSEEEDESSVPIVPQWPLLFNCHNLAAQMGGNQSFVQNEVPAPTAFAYLPGDLTETQVQWLMETLWAQRAFLSAYTNSIITNAGVFKNVHSLHIAKLSSGLIPCIAQDEFWSSLPSLKKLTLKISPDWRQEHVPGDKFFYRNMHISPVQASLKLAYLLERFVAKIENLSSLRTGFVGGGEHQSGIFGRNRHVLPAPITRDPHAWLTDHERKPASCSMFVFNHIRHLTFENCWFSPCMLEAFMVKSRDTSLHHLGLDSVSLTGVHDTRNDGPLTTEGHNLRCNYSPSEWLQETIPRNACWVNLLDKITPGKTILDRKYAAEMIDVESEPRPHPSFKGNIKEISLNSCGYAQISGIRSEQFSQNGLIRQNKSWHAVDAGLEVRRNAFYSIQNGDSQSRASNRDRGRSINAHQDWLNASRDPSKACIMMSTRDAENSGEYFGLGKLTQCIHPVEKRVLERAWGMRFGWGDTMERWAAVEDGWYEGGTGRFSGTMKREDDN